MHIVSGSGRLQPGDDPYRILGVSRTASDAEITSAYRRLLRQHHPDTAPGHTDNDRLHQIMAAYQQLRHRRAAGSSTEIPVRRHRTPPGHSADIWLGTRSGESSRRRILIRRRGKDTTAGVTIDADQARTGTVVTVAAPTDPTTEQRRTIRVRIPPGTRDGQTLRIAGHGTPGHNGGAPGDLHLTVYHAPVAQ